MADKPTVKLPLNERLRDSRRQATSLSLPFAVHHRLDLLAELGTDVHAARAEIIGMLIANADLDADEIERKVLTYRKMRVAEVVPAPDADGGAEVIELPRRGPGRPSHGTAG
jgi:hypothetical protein